MKKKLRLVMSLALIGMIAFAAIGSQDALAKSKTTVWRMNCSFSPQGYIADALRYFVNEVKTRSDGCLTVELYFNSSLGFKNTAILSSLKKGMVELSSMMGGNIDAELPLAGLLLMPFLHEDMEKSIEWQINTLTPAMNKMANERWNTSIIGSISIPAPAEFFSKKPLKTLEDLQGTRIRTWGGIPGEALHMIGAEPFTITTAELYTSLQRGMVSAALTSYISATECHFWEVLKYIDHIVLATNICSVAMNNDAYNRLPPDVQKAVMDSGKAVTAWAHENRQKYSDKMLKVLLDGGMVEVWPEPGEMEKIRAKCKPLYKKYADEVCPEAIPLLKGLGAY